MQICPLKDGNPDISREKASASWREWLGKKWDDFREFPRRGKKGKVPGEMSRPRENTNRELRHRVKDVQPGLVSLKDDKKKP